MSSARWCQILSASINAPDSGIEVGYAVAYIIDRSTRSPPDEDDGSDLFFMLMEDLSETAGELFNDRIFENDITVDEFLVFHDVVVRPEYRRQGLGKSMRPSLTMIKHRRTVVLMPCPF